MADVRSLLRNERASRRIAHPNAAYSSTGTLECTICRIPVKSDIDSWGQHLKSTQHAMRAERLRINQRSTSIGDPGDGLLATKKRKVADEDDDARKKAKPGPVTAQASHETTNDTQPQTRQVQFTKASSSDGAAGTTNTKPAPAEKNAVVDEDEWAAFERDVASSTHDDGSKSSVSAALMANASISAEPVLIGASNAADDRDQSPTRKERREDEMEAEKEDAVRALEEEFDEMAGLEERVRKLKERREALRAKPGAADDTGQAPAKDENPQEAVKKDEEDDDDDDDDNDELFDEWRFGS